MIEFAVVFGIVYLSCLVLIALGCGLYLLGVPLVERLVRWSGHE